MPESTTQGARPGRVPLRSVLAALTTLPVFVAVLLAGWLSVRNGERLVRGLVADLQLEVASGAEQALRRTLEPPHLLNGLNEDLLRQGAVDPADHDRLQRHFLAQLRRFPSAGYVQLGLDSGAFVGVERLESGFRVERTDPELTGKQVWDLDEGGHRVGPPIDAVPGYRATSRPWYRAAVDAGAPTWSSIYQFSSRGDVRLGVTAVQPWNDDDGTRLGVLGTDIVLAQLGRLMSTPRLRSGGRAFAMERDGLLVAHSSVDPPFEVTADRQAERLQAATAPDALTQAVTAELHRLEGGLAGIRAPLQLELPFEGDVAFVYVAPFEDGRGLDWLLVVAHPRVDFTPELRDNVAQTTALWVSAGLLALLLALWVSRQVALPVRQLAEASRHLREGRGHPLPQSRMTEVSELSEAFAQMRSELVEQQRQLAHTTQEAVAARHEAERANHAKSSFLAHMSHELRTPLNAILGYSELLGESEELSDDGRQDLARIRSAGTQLLSVISDVLDLSRIEAGVLEVHLSEVDVSQLVADAVSATQVLLESQGNDVRVSAPPSLVVHTDGPKLRQSVVNLLSNAAKFTENGVVEVAVDADDDQVTVRVTDSGIGIPADRLPALFAPFTQVEPGSHRHAGTGLGLAITREFARALGGDVSVDSELGVGTTFSITLPRRHDLSR